MNYTPIGFYLLAISPLLLAMAAGMGGIFRKAGEETWKAFVPGLNLWILLKMTGRPKWWLVLHLFPLTSGFVWLLMMSDLARNFGRYGVHSRFMAFFFPFLYLPWLAFSRSAVFNREGLRPKQDRIFLRELLDGLMYAGAAALFLRIFFFSTIRIPTPSMEGSLLVGDFVLVSKVHYGPRLPMSPAALPFMGNHLPGTRVKSYLPWIKFPYGRLPGFSILERNDIVVFNYPYDDMEPDAFSPDTVRIASQKQTYIKRCVALPGDFLQIKNGEVMINGKPGWVPPHMQEVYRVDTRRPLSPDLLTSQGFRVFGPNRDVKEQDDHSYEFFMSRAQSEFVASWDEVIRVEGPESVENSMKQNEYVFPRNPAKYRWDLYNFGMIRIPSRGDSVKLDEGNLVIYQRIIEGYEGHEFEHHGKQFLIDGEPKTHYTFEQNYYFMMGDNRFNSMDSRYWGFVPEDHILGKPILIVYSAEEGKFHGDRFMRRVNHYEP